MKKLLPVLFLAIVAAGCYNDNAEDLYPSTPNTNPNPNPNPNPGGDTVSFAAKIKPVLDSKCATPGCHDANSLGGGYNMSVYTDVKRSVTNNRLIGAITHASGFSQMPKGMPKLDQATIDLFNKWVDQGALNN